MAVQQVFHGGSAAYLGPYRRERFRCASCIVEVNAGRGRLAHVQGGARKARQHGAAVGSVGHGWQKHLGLICEGLCRGRVRRRQQACRLGGRRGGGGRQRFQQLDSRLGQIEPAHVGGVGGDAEKGGECCAWIIGQPQRRPGVLQNTRGRDFGAGDPGQAPIAQPVVTHLDCSLSGDGEQATGRWCRAAGVGVHPAIVHPWAQGFRQNGRGGNGGSRNGFFSGAGVAQLSRRAPHLGPAAQGRQQGVVNRRQHVRR